MTMNDINSTVVHSWHEIQTEVDKLLEERPINNTEMMKNLASKAKNAWNGRIDKTFKNPKVRLTIKFKTNQQEQLEVLNSVVYFEANNFMGEIGLKSGDINLDQNRITLDTHKCEFVDITKDTLYKGLIGEDSFICEGKKYNADNKLLFEGKFENNLYSDGKEYDITTRNIIYSGKFLSGERHGEGILYLDLGYRPQDQVKVLYDKGFLKLMETKNPNINTYLPKNTKIKLNRIDSDGLIEFIIVCSHHDKYKDGFEAIVRTDEQGKIQKEAIVKISKDLTFTGSIREDYTPYVGLITDKEGNVIKKLSDNEEYGTCSSSTGFSFSGPLKEGQPHGAGELTLNDITIPVKIEGGKKIVSEIDLDDNDQLLKLLDEEYDQGLLQLTENEEQLRCPISKEFIREPVCLVENGHYFYFEKRSLVQWLITKKVNPLTRNPIQGNIMSPNHAFTIMRILFMLNERVDVFSSSRIGVFEQGKKDTMFDEAIIHSLSAEVIHKELMYLL